MNIDFADHAGFSAYVLLLMFSGAAMLAMGSPAIKRQRTSSRVLNILFGLGFFGYGFYLAFLFKGGTYVIFFQAFIVPVLMLVRTLQSSRRSRSAASPLSPYLAQTQYGPWTQQPAANSWAAPHAAGASPWPDPRSLAPTYEPSLTQAAGQSNTSTDVDRNGPGRHRDRSESPDVTSDGRSSRDRDTR